MKLRADQLTQQLSKGLSPVYLVSGDETLLVQECCDEIRATCKQAGYLERDVMNVDTSFDWQQLLSAGNSLSLFSEKKVIELRMPKGKPGTKGSQAIQSYLAKIPEDTILLIVSCKLESSASRSKWVKAIETAGLFLPIWPIDSKQLPNWINQRFRDAGMKAHSDAIRLLAEQVEGNLLAAAQEIEKLKLLDLEEITADTISNAVSSSARYDVFGLADAALEGNTEQTIRMLNGLRSEGAEPTVVLWALVREIRSLASMAEAVQQGSNINQVLQQFRVWDKKKTITSSALQRHSVNRFQQLLQQAMQVDKSIKGMAQDNPWDLLSSMCMRLSR